MCGSMEVHGPSILTKGGWNMGIDEGWFRRRLERHVYGYMINDVNYPVRV